MRAERVLPAGSWDVESAFDQVIIDFDHRFRRRILLKTEGQLELLLDLAHTIRLRDEDGLQTEAGIVRVRAKAEQLMAITAPDAHTLLRIAWHLGNRHLAVQILPHELRLQRDHVIATMVVGLGGTVTDIDAAFDPEAGAYHQGDDHSH